ncbi:MAG: BamA/TamA family outer membrane protein [Rikenellaceae bacterium]
MKKILLFLSVILVFFGCASTQKVPTGEYLLRRNSIILNYSDSVVREHKTTTPYILENYIPMSQTPNKRILGVPLYLNAYNLIDSTKQNWFQDIFRKIGEEPIIYNASQNEVSKNEMTLFMQNSGFYSATIQDTVKFKKKKAMVSYEIESGLPTIISSVKYNFIDSSLLHTILSDSTNSLIKTGALFSKYELTNERTRISNHLENIGYYGYSVNNISFLVDTLNKDREAEITIQIGDRNRMLTLGNNHIYRIRNIYVNGDYSSIDHKNTIYDTTEYKGLFILTKKGEKQNIKSRTLMDLIPIKPNDIYSKQEINYTRSNLSSLRFFKNINITFNEVDVTEDQNITFLRSPEDSISQYTEKYIDCNIQCIPTKRQSAKINSELSSNANYTGVSVTFGYANKNLFRGAEIFDIGFTTAYDIMHSSESKNSYEYGVSTSLTFPKLIAPFKLKNENIYSLQTRIELSYDYQTRTYYRRTVSNVAFGYQWEKKQSSFVFKPLSISYINVPWVDEDFWDSIENKYLQTSYTSQLVLGTASSYSFSNSSFDKQLTSTLKINAETSGNFLSLIANVFDTPYHSEDSITYRKALGVRYSQYFKIDASYILNQKIGTNGALVFRAYAGGGYAYDNTYTLPFEKMFFVGGASSMRGWQVRTLGPGATPPVDDDYPEQVGNIRLEANLEGRFHVAGPVSGAVFLDCGNIWSNYKGQDSDDVSRLKLNTLAQQLALNTGLGARFDFDFFILRLDWGIILRNPGWDAGERWISSFNLKNTAVHFGIGYPF